MKLSVYRLEKIVVAKGTGNAKFIPSLKQLSERRDCCLCARSQDQVVTSLCDSVLWYVLSFIGKEKIGDLCIASSVRIIKYITIGRWLAASAGSGEHEIISRINGPVIPCLMALSFTFSIT